MLTLQNDCKQNRLETFGKVNNNRCELILFQLWPMFGFLSEDNNLLHLTISFICLLRKQKRVCVIF